MADLYRLPGWVRRIPMYLIVCVAQISGARTNPAFAQLIPVPTNTWVAVPFPETGVSLRGGSKHLRFAYRSADGRIYQLGGDFGTSQSNPEMYSYDVTTNSWIQEQPLCKAPGELEQDGPDEVGWVYDSRRDIFWMIPGFMDHVTKCPDGPTLLINQVMTWDPNTHTWMDPGAVELGAGCGVQQGIHKFAVYDRATDRIIVFSYDKSCEYAISTNTWTSRLHDLGSGYWIIAAMEYTAHDEEGRLIYVLDGAHGRLYSYQIDTHHWTDLGPTPATPGREGVVRIVWDSHSRVVLWPFREVPGSYEDPIVYVYNPRAATWTARFPTNDTGRVIGVGSIAYDPVQNVMISMSTCCDYDNGEAESAKNHFFLYRYGAGTDLIPPSPPATLIAR